MTRRSLALPLALLAACASPGSRPADPAVTLAFTHVAVVDVEQGRVLPDRTVLIAGDRIALVAEDAAVPAGVQVVEARGQYLIPGLWDMHAHLWDGDVTVPLFVANGVTGVRDMGSDLASTLELRAAIRQGRRAGPRIVTAGPIVDGPREGDGPPPRLRATTPEEARRAVATLQQSGADFVKVYHFLPREAYFALADEARRRGMAFAGHLPPQVTAAEAVAAGQRSLEHLYGTREQAIGAATAGPPLEETFRLFAGRGTWQTPTLAHYRSAAFRDAPGSPYADDPHAAYLTREMRAFWDEHMPARPATPEQAAARADGFRRLQESIARMQALGVGLLAGSDNGIKYVYPGFGLQDELAQLAAAGLTPAEALRTATVNPAKCLGMADSLGSVAAGRLADLVLLAANPLEDIANTRRVQGVVLDGRYLDRAALDRLLAEARQAAGSN